MVSQGRGCGGTGEQDLLGEGTLQQGELSEVGTVLSPFPFGVQVGTCDYILFVFCFKGARPSYQEQPVCEAIASGHPYIIALAQIFSF